LKKGGIEAKSPRGWGWQRREKRPKGRWRRDLRVLEKEINKDIVQKAISFRPSETPLFPEKRTKAPDRGPKIDPEGDFKKGGGGIGKGLFVTGTLPCLKNPA